MLNFAEVGAISTMGGMFGGCHPYLREMASLNAYLWKGRPNSSRGRVVSQLEVPFSWVVRCRWLGSFSLMAWISLFAVIWALRYLQEFLGLEVHSRRGNVD